MDNVLKCPCCNGDAKIEKGYSGLTFQVICKKCDLRTGANFSKEDAVECWNRREWYSVQNTDK